MGNFPGGEAPEREAESTASVFIREVTSLVAQGCVEPPDRPAWGPAGAQSGSEGKEASPSLPGPGTVCAQALQLLFFKISSGF